MILEILLLIFSYLCGSIPVGYLIGIIFYGIDIRKHGSGNIGAANAFRILGKKAGIFTMLGDIFKGAIAVFSCRLYLWFGSYDAFGTSSWSFSFDQGFFLAMSGFMAVIGHSYPVWFRFKGGKSASVSAGGLLAINPIAFAVTFILWLIILAKTRYTSLSNIIVAWLLPPFYWFFAGPKFFNNNSLWALIIGFVIVMVVYWRHRENIKRLIQGNERKFGQKEQININQ